MPIRIKNAQPGYSQGDLVFNVTEVQKTALMQGGGAVIEAGADLPAALGLSADAVTAVNAAVSGGTLSQVGRRVIIFGDSRTQQNTDQSATSITGRPRYWHWAQALSGHRLDLINNAGVNGDTVAGMLSRVNGSNYGVGFGQIGDAGAAAVSPGVLGMKPDFVVFNGGYNDIFGNSQTADATYAIAVQILDAIRLAGVTIIVCSAVFPSSASIGFTAAKCRELRLYNDKLNAYANSYRTVYYCDFAAAAISPLSTSVETAAADLRDGTVHENNRAAKKEGKVLATLISTLIPARQQILPISNAETSAFDPSIPQLVVNPLRTGTAAITTTGYSGNAAGSEMTNANFVRGGSSNCVLSAVARNDGYGQNTQFTCTFSAANDTFELRMPSLHAQAVVGGRYRAVCEVSYTGPSGADLAAVDNLRGTQLYIQYNDGTTNYFSYSMGFQITDGALVGSDTLTLVTPDFVLPPGGTPTIFRVNFTVSANGAGSPQVQVGRIGLYRIG
jgi:lysophospholipase L1-like esterase